MLTTAFTSLFGTTTPLALAPMGGAAGGALAAAVSNGGGLGLLGAGRADDPAWLEHELDVLCRGRGGHRAPSSRTSSKPATRHSRNSPGSVIAAGSSVAATQQVSSCEVSEIMAAPPGRGAKG